MPRKHFRKYLPSHAWIRGRRYLGPFRAMLDHPNLWHLNRRSVAGGVAIGVFAGLIPGPVQMLCAALLAIPVRVNLPVAMATTLYTNPFTIGPLYLIAYAIGKPFTGESGPPQPVPEWIRCRMCSRNDITSFAEVPCTVMVRSREPKRIRWLSSVSDSLNPLRDT